jgi:uncharacterized membrane protein
MNRRNAMWLAAAVLTAGAASFVTGRLVASRGQGTPASVGWLHNAPVHVQETERQFEQHARQLTQTVTTHKSDLAAMLADPCSADTEILAQVERVLESNAALMTAVGTHIVELRSSLAPQEKQRLMRSCVDSFQGQVQRRYRWRGGAPEDGSWQGRGNGYGGGRGRGGYGPGSRPYRGGRSGGNEPVDRLQLTAGQAAFAQEHDPNFAADSARLKDEVAAACASLQAGLEDAQAGNDELLARLDRLIEAHRRLELRVARYVVMIRPQLSAPQRQRLAGLSRGSSRYRRGRSMSDSAGSIGLLGAGGLFE